MRMARRLQATVREHDMINTADAIEKKLAILSRPLKLDLSINDLRIIVGCFRAVAYQMKVDDEPYLDCEGLALKATLSSMYEKILRGD